MIVLVYVFSNFRLFFSGCASGDPSPPLSCSVKGQLVDDYPGLGGFLHIETILSTMITLFSFRVFFLRARPLLGAPRLAPWWMRR